MLLIFISILAILLWLINDELNSRQERLRIPVRQCAGCHATVESDWLVCPRCHTLLQEHCESCGKTHRKGENFCPWCGGNKQVGGRL
ncbi:MAG: hypothetical protein C0616_06525 [Desulfuromonas sp.]|nr:MAG: hypothetical protein C0616_06525 [Desulfuromonas sp.]